MTATLQITSGAHQGESVAIGTSLIIGRADADLVLDDPEVSRRHAEIRRTETGYEIEDLASRNGTFVDGAAVSGAAALTPGCHLRIGQAELVFHADERVAETVLAPLRAPGGGEMSHPPVPPSTPQFEASPLLTGSSTRIASRQMAPLIATLSTMIIVPLVLIAYFWQHG